MPDRLTDRYGLIADCYLKGLEKQLDAFFDNDPSPGIKLFVPRIRQWNGTGYFSLVQRSASDAEKELLARNYGAAEKYDARMIVIVPHLDRGVKKGDEGSFDAKERANPLKGKVLDGLSEFYQARLKRAMAEVLPEFENVNLKSVDLDGLLFKIRTNGRFDSLYQSPELRKVYGYTIFGHMGKPVQFGNEVSYELNPECALERLAVAPCALARLLDVCVAKQSPEFFLPELEGAFKDLKISRWRDLPELFVHRVQYNPFDPSKMVEFEDPEDMNGGFCKGGMPSPMELSDPWWDD